MSFCLSFERQEVWKPTETLRNSEISNVLGTENHWVPVLGIWGGGGGEAKENDQPRI